MAEPMNDLVNDPPHYQGSVECIDALESIGVGEHFCRGNAIKYLWRLGKKDDPLQDARKAQWYVNRLVAALEKKADEAKSNAPEVSRAVGDPHWEAVEANDQTGLCGYLVRWSACDVGGRFLWVGHYYANEDRGEGPSLSWCKHAAESQADRMNEQRRQPWEFDGFKPTTPTEKLL